MLTAQEKSRITQTIQEIKTILEEVASNPDDYDLLKTACEIYTMSQVEANMIVENLKDYWACQNSGQADWRG